MLSISAPELIKNIIRKISQETENQKTDHKKFKHIGKHNSSFISCPLFNFNIEKMDKLDSLVI